MTPKLTINEIFFSIQGESSFAGLPCVFVRLSFCNLRCTYCDTEYAFDEGREYELDEVEKVVQGYPSDLVEITGGEPLLQPAVFPLIERLLDQGKTVLIETGGSVDVCPVDERAILIYDVKCPDSGMDSRNRWENLKHLKAKDEIKFVIGSRADYDWSCSILEQYDLCGRHRILFSPVWGELQPRELAEWILDDALPVRLQLQLHKFVWGPEVRGV